MKMKLLLVVGLLAGSLSLSLFSTNPTYATDNSHSNSIFTNLPAHLFIFSTHEPGHFGDTAGGEAGGEAGETQTTTSCAVEGIGWIICPVVKEVSKVVDSAYGIVSHLLTVAPLLTTGEQAHVYQAWTIMRNFANVAFVIAFLIIIFSQLTSVGLNNYGIKKMLPRLIVAAILVNASFWICAIAVDVSNILGSSINGVFQGITVGEGTERESTAGMPTKENSSQIGGREGWEGLTIAILAGGIGALHVGLSALLPALLAAAIAIITVFIILSLRQALIVLLVIVSPLAFVAYLLPNTESMFKKWYGLFKTLLLMYPIISMIFGASALASAIVLTTPQTPENEIYYIAIQIMGALMAIIPLALTPILMKTAGGLLGKVGAFVNNPNKGPFDRMRKGAEGIRKRQEGRRAIRELNGGPTMGFGKYKRAAKRERIEAGIDSEKKRASNKYIADQVMNNSAFANKAAGGLNIGGPSASGEAIERALAGAKFVVQQAEIEEVKAESAKVEHMDASQLMQDIFKHDDEGEMLRDSNNRPIRNTNSSDARVSAAIERLVNVGDVEHIEAVANEFGTDKQGDDIGVINRVLAESLSKNGPEFLKASDIDNIKRGTMATTKDKLDANGNKILGADNKPVQEAVANAFQHVTQTNLEAGVMSQEKMVSATNNTLNYANTVATPAGRQRLTDTANELMASEVLRGKIKHNATQIETIAGQQPTTVHTTNNQNVTINNTGNPNTGRTTPPSTAGYTQQGGLFIPHGTQLPSQQQSQQPPQGPPRTPPRP